MDRASASNPVAASRTAGAAVIRQWLAKRRLQRIVEARRNSFEVIDYRRRRQAALKHTRAGNG
jgi:hypothetical protein